MTRSSAFSVMAAVLLTLVRAHAATPADDALAQIAGALSNNEAHEAELLATAALGQDELSVLQRARLLLNRGVALELQGAHAGALTDLTQAINSLVLPPSEQAFALFERGMAQDGLGRLSEALADYDASLKTTADSAPVLNNRANVLRRLGRFDEARRDYLASLAAGNARPEYPYFGLGQIAEAEGNPETAKGHYAKAVATNPDYSLAAGRLKALEPPSAAEPADDGIIRLRPPKGVETGVQAGAPSLSMAARLPAVPPLPGPDSASSIHLRSPAEWARAAAARVPLRPAIIDRTERVSGSAQVQLGAWRQEAEASQAWTRAVNRVGGDLAALSPSIVPVDLPGRGRYYRLRVSPGEGAAEFCAGLAAKGLDCLPVRD